MKPTNISMNMYIYVNIYNHIYVYKYTFPFKLVDWVQLNHHWPNAQGSWMLKVHFCLTAPRPRSSRELRPSSCWGSTAALCAGLLLCCDVMHAYHVY